jgi:hypothetical protein
MQSGQILLSAHPKARRTAMSNPAGKVAIVTGASRGISGKRLYSPEMAGCSPTDRAFLTFIGALPATLPRFDWREPSELPVEQPVKFELAVNLKAAKALVL